VDQFFLTVAHGGANLFARKDERNENGAAIGVGQAVASVKKLLD
jgi:hypothetical protein